MPVIARSRCVLALLLAVLAAVSVSAPAWAQFEVQSGAQAEQPEIRWVSFSPDDKAFTVTMPVQPAMGIFNGKDGDVSFTQTRYTAQIQGFAVLATVAEYPAGSQSPSPEVVRDGVLSSLKLTMIFSMSHPYTRGFNDVVQGVEFAGKNDTQTCKSDVYVDGFKVFAVLACAQAGTNHVADTEFVLRSFRLPSKISGK